MNISRASDYAIRGLVYMAKQPAGTVCYVKDIAKNTNSPASFMSKIFQTLAKSGIIDSFIGTKGGFTFNARPEDITIKKVVEIIDGPIVLNRCVVNKSSCQNAGNCDVHFMWADIQKMLTKALSSYSIADFATDKKGNMLPEAVQ
ncbi:MAG: Rrf2 family transcriptional regulator [Deltaproteobacteria bacterium]|jgi:Rrf2 family protein|uniref:Rrf2 family transcriptional regulator n=1 Tax=Candidatus Acidulodesulfobacterium acidiphilum TaxID=2597224 RepID=A0A520XHB0_9DELT|nr:Rrf2 family transcriptional regulator [Deltaproteobacteria bacterium]MDA8299212.1 Rrf2 family transcriptional regulator [Deltaproteobacteria bacterium]RZV40559.1 MAG: Rrf2 family transcriptional regulator [Candidatus Acidulodesulfobacterium acidiphilum]